MAITTTIIPNLRSDERGYNTGNENWPYARVRVTPVEMTPAIANVVNGPVVPSCICVQISASLVDDEGAVLTIGGRYLVLDGARHTYIPGAAEPFNPEQWFTLLVEKEINKLTRIADDLSAAEEAGFLVAT